MDKIFIPSKGRSASKLFKELETAILVVEPSEYALYRTNNSNSEILILPEDNRGIAYARQFIHTVARKLSLEWFWMLDDDITAFYETIAEGKTKKIEPGSALVRAAKLIKNVPLAAQGGLESVQYACRTMELYKTKSHCEGCNLFNVERTRTLNYRQDLVMKEDKDFSLQVLAAGYDNVLVKRISCACPTVGTKKGGLKSLYDNPENDRIASEQIVKIWGDRYCKVVLKKTGRVDVRIQWRKFAQDYWSRLNSQKQQVAL